MKIGRIIKDYCLSHGMTQQEFAIRSKVTKGYITMLIKNENPKTGKPMRPTIETYINIAETMGMTVDDLFRIMDDAPVEFNVPLQRSAPPLTEEEQRLVVAYRNADDRAKADALNTLLTHPIQKVRV